jgi:hypothetical protein
MPVVIIDSSSTTFGGGEAHEVHKGYENIAEAQLVVDVIRRLTESSRMGDPVLSTSIGICTPYKRQVALIKYKLQQMTKQGGFKYNSVTVATADAFQGSERDYMIVSTVRTSTSGIEFALSQKRLNVMLTRGKVLTVVVSNKTMFERKDMVSLINRLKTSPDARRGGEAFRGLFKWAMTHGVVYNADNWALIFQTNSVTSSYVEQQDRELVEAIHSVSLIDIDGRSELCVEGLSQTHYCRLVKDKNLIGWELAIQSGESNTRIRVLKEGWSETWAHIPVQLQIVFHSTTDMQDVKSTGRLHISHGNVQMRITDSNQVQVMAQAYQHLIAESDKAGMQVIVVPLGPYHVDVKLVEEYTQTCLDAMVKEVRSCKSLREIYLLDAPD